MRSFSRTSDGLSVKDVVPIEVAGDDRVPLQIVVREDQNESLKGEKDIGVLIVRIQLMYNS